MNSSYNTFLYLGGWSSTNSDNISRIRTSTGNLHIDSAANGSCYLNWYSGGSIQLGRDTTVRGSVTATSFNGNATSASSASSAATLSSQAYINRVRPYSNSYGTGYGQASLEIREYNLENAAGGTEWSRAPRIGFHWGGRVASQFLLQSDGTISCVNNPGNGYEKFSCGGFYSHTSTTSQMDGGLRVYGTEVTTDYAPSSNDYFTNGGSIQGDSPNLNFGLYVANSIRGAGIVVFSDRRIKSNIVDIHDTIALDQVRLLKPKYYEYVDKVSKGTPSVIGFIAQEVKEVLPRAVSVTNGEIPNIYETATISSSNTVTFTNFNTSDFDGLGKLIVYLAEDKREQLTIVEVVDEHTVRVEEDMSEWGATLFVWGQKVDDFHHMNKDYIFTVATAALQEVDRQQQSDKARITTLETQLQAERARNDSLEARILALENK